MPSYYFRVCTPDRVNHLAEHHDLPDLTAALAAAQRSARILVRNPVRRGRLAIAGSLDIENEARQAVARLMLSEFANQIS